MKWSVCRKVGLFVRELIPFLLAAIGLLACASIRANNIQVLNPTLTGINYTQQSVQVRFDVVWEHSWRMGSLPDSWDAAWLFVKYRHAGTGAWGHARLNNTGHVAPAGSTIDEGLLVPGTPFDPVTNPAVGVFLHLSAGDFGTFNGQGVVLRWNYGASGLAYTDIAEVSVFALEMVYIPEGPFWVGDGTTTTVRGQFHNAGSVTTPFQIASESAFTLGGTTSGNLSNNNGGWPGSPDDFNNATAHALPASYPKGFKGFYCMKHEISQQGYVDFLNTLTRAQQDGRTQTNLAVGVGNVSNRYVMVGSSVSDYRNGVRCNATIDPNAPITFYCDLNGNGTGGEANDGLWLACSYLGWGDVAAYLDWAGLRPLTDLEFEKACRGPLPALPDEFPWGSTAITQATGLVDAGTLSETCTPAAANAAYGTNVNVQCPVRTGVFARGTTTRVQAGAGYYGVLDLGGGLWEQAVSLGSASGRSFTGTHGNGSLSASGMHDPTSWPAAAGPGVGQRGGSWGNIQTALRVADRTYANSIGSRNSYQGGRGGRTHP